jgi:hypothetical protein
MAQQHKADPNTIRIMQWLAEHSAEFEQGSIEEAQIASAVGLANDDVTTAIDWLENKEAVVRFPHPLSTPARTMLKPGRGWHDLLEKETGKPANP